MRPLRTCSDSAPASPPALCSGYYGSGYLLDGGSEKGSTSASWVVPASPWPQRVELSWPTDGLVFAHRDEELYAGGDTLADACNGTVTTNAIASGLPMSRDTYAVALEFKCSAAPSESDVVYTLYAWGSSGTAENTLSLRSNAIRHDWGVLSGKAPLEADPIIWTNGGLSMSGICDGSWHAVSAQFDGTTRSIIFDGTTVASDTPTDCPSPPPPTPAPTRTVSVLGTGVYCFGEGSSNPEIFRSTDDPALCESLCLQNSLCRAFNTYVDSTCGDTCLHWSSCDSPITSSCSGNITTYAVTDASEYCGDSTCGAALLSGGWKVLSEWGTVNRFGDGLIGSHADFLAEGWFVPGDGSVAANQFNFADSWDTDSQVTQWYASTDQRAAYEHNITVGTTQVVVAFAGSSASSSSSFSCTASIYDSSGALVYNRTRQGDGFSPFPDPDVVTVDTSAGAARIRFKEDEGICWTAYVLYDAPDLPPPSTPTDMHADTNGNFCLGNFFPTDASDSTVRGFEGSIRNFEVSRWPRNVEHTWPADAPVFTHLGEEVYTPSSSTDVDCGRGTIQSNATAAGLPTGTESYTVSLEFNCSSASPDTGHALYSWGSAGANMMNALEIRPGFLLHYWWGDDLRWTVSTSGKTIDNICDGAWHTVMTQFDGTTRRLVFDGVTVASDTPSGSHANINTNFCLGGRGDGSNEAFAGSIRNLEVSRWPRQVQLRTRASQVPVAVSHDGGTTLLSVDQTSRWPLAADVWNAVGTFSFTSPGSVTVSTAGTSEPVVVDAVRLTPVSSTAEWALALQTTGVALADSPLFGYDAPLWSNASVAPFGDGTPGVATLTSAFTSVLAESVLVTMNGFSKELAPSANHSRRYTLQQLANARDWYPALVTTSPHYNGQPLAPCMQLVGWGFCSSGYFDGWDASIANEDDCKAKCLSEPDCLFASLEVGRTCSRYNSGANGCTRGVSDAVAEPNYMTYAKVGCSTTAGNFTYGGSPLGATYYGAFVDGSAVGRTVSGSASKRKVADDTKCSGSWGTRLFRLATPANNEASYPQTKVTPDFCAAICAGTAGCTTFNTAYASSDRSYCLGCNSSAVAASQAGNTLYELTDPQPSPTPLPYVQTRSDKMCGASDADSNRLFNYQTRTPDTCAIVCAATPGCSYFSHGACSEGIGSCCMGCRFDSDNADASGYSFYRMTGPPPSRFRATTNDDGSIEVRDNNFFEVSASTMGDWGLGDFSVSVTIQALQTDFSPDNNAGTLFSRRGGCASDTPCINPSAYLYDDMTIVFRTYDWGSGQFLKVNSGLTDYNSPHTLVFARVGRTLTVHVDGAPVGSVTADPPVDTTGLTTVPLRFAANEFDENDRNLAMSFFDIKISGSSNASLGTASTPLDVGLFSRATVDENGVSTIDVWDNEYFEIDASTMGDWGAGDFSVSVTIQALEADFTPDGTAGALFIRSSHFVNPFTGPTVFLFDDMTIQFRTERDDSRQRLTVNSGLTDYNLPHTLVFARVGRTLTVHVDGTQVGSLTADPPTDPSLFTSAPLRFAANGQTCTGQNLKMRFLAIEVLGPAHFPTVFNAEAVCAAEQPNASDPRGNTWGLENTELDSGSSFASPSTSELSNVECIYGFDVRRHKTSSSATDVQARIGILVDEYATDNPKCTQPGSVHGVGLMGKRDASLNATTGLGSGASGYSDAKLYSHAAQVYVRGQQQQSPPGCEVVAVTSSVYPPPCCGGTDWLGDLPGRYFNVHHACFDGATLATSGHYEVEQRRADAVLWTGEVQLWWTNENSGFTGAALGRRSSGEANGQWEVGDRIVFPPLLRSLLHNHHIRHIRHNRRLRRPHRRERPRWRQE